MLRHHPRALGVLADRLPRRALLVGGDLVRLFIDHPQGVTLDLCERVTHHLPEVGENARLLRRANRGGFRVNVSTESERAADAAIAQGLPAVMAVPSSETRITWRTPEGNRVLVCPAQRSDTRQCADCALCHTRGRRVIIAFLAHGTGKTKANAVISEALANG